MKDYCLLLKNLLKEEGAILVPGCYDALSATILKKAGFPLIYMTGSGVSASVLGKSDLGLITMPEMVNQAKSIVNATNMPLICDADTGYGNSINVIRTVQEFENVGVAGIHIEDQLSPKRCGHFEGKEVIAAEEMVKKIEAAIYARSNDNFMIIARSDAREVLGFEEVLRRGRIYCEAGADMLFIEALHSLQEMEIVARTFVDMPLLINIVEGGKTPVLPLNYLQELGFKIVLYPTSGVRVVMKSLQDYAQHLYKNGDSKEFSEQMISFEGRNSLLGLSEMNELIDRF